MQALNDSAATINKYLRSLSYEDIEELYSAEREEEIINNLKGIIDKDSYFLLSGKLFSQIVTQKMALYNEARHIEYLWQKNFMDIFKKIYEEAREKGSEPWEAEVQSAKILWNTIEKNQFSISASSILDQREEVITPQVDTDLIKKFNIQNNLISIVRNSVTLLRPPSSIYQEATNLVEKAIKLYQTGRYRETNVLFELALKNIQALEGINTAVSFAVLAGCLQFLNNTTISKGVYFFQRAEKLLDSIDDKSNIGSTLDEMSKGYWKIGSYKKALEMLSLQHYIYTLQQNELMVMLTEEKLSNFYHALSRYIEAQEWSLHFLNSAVRSTSEDIKIAYFLHANLNYAKTLLGLNSWNKAVEHLNYAERTLNHLELPIDIRNPILIDISRMRGDIAVSKGEFNVASRVFEQRKEELVTLETTSPIFTRFIRSEAIFYRNQAEFEKGIEILQPLFQEKNQANPRNILLLAELLTLHSNEESALKLLDQAEKRLSQWNSIHGLSTIYLSKGYTYLLMEDFETAAKWLRSSLDVISTDLVDLKSFVNAHLNLSYIELEKGNFKSAEYHVALADERASQSGSLALLLDVQFLKANLRIKQGMKIPGLKMLQHIAKEAKSLEIMYMYNKVQARLEDT